MVLPKVSIIYAGAMDMELMPSNDKEKYWWWFLGVTIVVGDTYNATDGKLTGLFVLFQMKQCV